MKTAKTVANQAISTPTDLNLPLALKMAQIVINQEKIDFFDNNRLQVKKIDPWSVAVLERLQEFCLRSGKAVRPLLVAVGASLVTQESFATIITQPPIKKAMLLVELKHKRLLMADDIADQDKLRNGQPSFHIKWQMDLAKSTNYQNLSSAQLEHIARSYTEVAGIWLDGLSTQIIADSVFSADDRVDIMQLLSRHYYNNTVAGWFVTFDQNHEKLTDQTSEDTLLKGLELVSGEYTFVNPLKIGFKLGQNYIQKNQKKDKTKKLTKKQAINLSQLETAIEHYGQAAGTLFQITDDLLSAFGQPEVTGKPVGGDFKEGKKTLLVQYAYRHGNDKQRKFLQNKIGRLDLSNQEVKQIQTILNQTGAIEYAKSRVQDFAKKAQDALESVPTSPERKILLDLIEYIANRNK